MKLPLVVFAACLALSGAISGCKSKSAAADPASGPAAPARVKVPEAKCEVALPANMIIADAKASGFKIVEKGKDPTFHGMLVVVMPVGPIGSLAPPDATDVQVLKDQKNPDGSVAREGSYKTAVQTLHVAEYVYPVGKEWLHCKIAAAKPERRDEIARLCAGLAPTAL
jgi:hypothetical protein